MASITIRNLDERVKQGLRVQAAKNGLSMEEQARQFLSDCITQPRKMAMQTSRLNLAEFIDDAMRKAGGGIELEPFPKSPVDLKRLRKRLGIRPDSKRS